MIRYGRPVVLGHIEDRDRVRMLQPRRDPPLPPRPQVRLPHLGTAHAGVRPQLLHRDITAEHLVTGPPHDPHRPAAELRHQSVTAGDQPIPVSIATATTAATGPARAASPAHTTGATRTLASDAHTGYATSALRIRHATSTRSIDDTPDTPAVPTATIPVARRSRQPLLGVSSHGQFPYLSPRQARVRGRTHGPQGSDTWNPNPIVAAHLCSPVRTFRDRPQRTRKRLTHSGHG